MLNSHSNVESGQLFFPYSRFPEDISFNLYKSIIPDIFLQL